MNDKELDQVASDCLSSEDSSQERKASIASLVEESWRLRRARERRVRVASCAVVILALSSLILPYRPAILKWDLPSVRGEMNLSSPVEKGEPRIPGTTIAVIDDDELLELLKGRPLAWIRNGQSERLVVLDSAP